MVLCMLADSTQAWSAHPCACAGPGHRYMCSLTHLLRCVSTRCCGCVGVSGDIELVVHYNLPRSIEGFYQVSGLPVPARGFWDGGSRDPKPYTMSRQLLATQSCPQAPP